jgi:hypothetical protein
MGYKTWYFLIFLEANFVNYNENVILLVIATRPIDIGMQQTQTFGFDSKKIWVWFDKQIWFGFGFGFVS